MWPPCSFSNKEPSKTTELLPCSGHARNKRGYLQDLPTRATAAFKGAATKGVYVACVLVFVMNACLCLCRLLRRDQHDDTCLFVFVMHARSCLCRLLQPQCRKEEDIERGMAGAAAVFTGTSSRDIHGSSRSSSTSKRALGCLHLSVPLTGRVSAPGFSVPMGGATVCFVTVFV